MQGTLTGSIALLAAAPMHDSGAESLDCDWVVPSGQVVIFDTVSSIVVTTAGPKTFTGGVVEIDDFHVEPGAALVIQGPNPMALTATGSVRIEGLVDLSGTSSPGVNTLNTTAIPEPGAPGQAGGGSGGTGSPLTAASSPVGGAGLQPLGRQRSALWETTPQKDTCPPGFTGCLGHVDGAGGDGGPGLIQLHVPVSDALSSRLRLPAGQTAADLFAPLPVATGSGCQLLPTFRAPSARPRFRGAGLRLSLEDLRFRPDLGFLRR